MADMTEYIQKALNYMESNLTEQLQIREIARVACLSPYYFQRIFGALCGVGVSEYMRARRLTLAGEELARTDARVIDIAAKYGYDSPDSFNRAFQRFHGISPSAVRKKAARLVSFEPIKLQERGEDKQMLEYKIQEKPQLTVVGVYRKFHPETSYHKIPEYWTEIMEDSRFSLMGMYGICMDGDDGSGSFDYWIADDHIPGKEIPAGCEILTIPAETWAVFSCKLKSLQETNKKVWQQWLPNCREYRLAGGFDVEAYGPFNEEDPEQTDVELWLPVV